MLPFTLCLMHCALPLHTATHLQTNRDTAAKANKATEIAIAGVVLAVVLAVVAIALAGAYVAKTKKLDEKCEEEGASIAIWGQVLFLGRRQKQRN